MNSESYVMKRKFIMMVINKIRKMPVHFDMDKTVSDNSDDEQFPDIVKLKDEFVYSPARSYRDFLEDSDRYE